MKNNKQQLLLQQTDKKIQVFKELKTVRTPTKGWINTFRIALKMSLRQLGHRLQIAPQSVKEIEVREANGTITLKSLRDVANALDMQLVYGFVSKHESLEQMIEKRAKELAKEIVLPKSSEKVINTFSFEGLTPVVVASVSGTNITATVPFGTDVTKLVATFTASSKATLSIGQTIQKSGTSINDFTKSVTYIVTAEDGTTKTYIVTVTIDKNPLGMDEVAASNVAVYPNPNSGVFFVEAATGELEVTILDLHGREVYRYANNAFLGDKMAIDLHELPSSSYVIRITNNGESTQQKLALIK